MAELKNLIVNGNARINGNLYAESIKKNGGTSSQFLKADGSVDNNTYSTTDTATTFNGHYIPTASTTGGTVVISASTAIKGIKMDAKGHITEIISGSVLSDAEEEVIADSLNALNETILENEYVVAQALSRLNSEPHEIYSSQDDDIYYIMEATNVGGNSNLYGSTRIYADNNGNLTAQSFNSASDERLKDFGKNINLDFAKLKSIPKKYFTWKDDETKKVEIGTSAQALQKVYPEIVTYNESLDTYAVDYSKLAIVALAAIDKLNDKIAKLEKTLRDNGITE